MTAAAHRLETDKFDQRLSALKVIGSIGTIMVHTSMYTLAHEVRAGDLSWWLADLGNSLGRSSSSLFIMVAGAILLGRPIDQQPVRFFTSRARRLLPAIIFWSAFYLGWRQLTDGDLTVARALRDVVAGTPSYHLWFLFGMLGLYALMPAARLLVGDSAQRRTSYWTLAASMVYTWIATTELAILQHGPIFFIAFTPLMLPFLLAGYLFYRDGLRVSTAWLWGGAGAGVAGLCLLMATLPPAGSASAAGWHQFLRVPLTFLWIFALFLLLLRWSPHGWLATAARWLAPITLGIYVVHPFWIDCLAFMGLPIKHPDGFWPFYAVLVYTLSAATAFLVRSIPGARRLVC